jgi:hypothetical protein
VFSESILPGGFVAVEIFFEVTGSVGASPLLNKASVEGGGSVSSVVEERNIGVGKGRALAGVTHFGFEATGPRGERLTQASGHPTFLTTSLLLSSFVAEGSQEEPLRPVEGVRDLVFYLPLGMLGDTTVAGLCPPAVVETFENETGCPPSSRIGSVVPMILGAGLQLKGADPLHGYGLYNIVPEKGYAAEFAFTDASIEFVSYVGVVRHDSQYMIRVSVPGVPIVSKLTGLIATFDGDIAEHFGEQVNDRGSFLTDPSDCREGPSAREASVALDTWQNPSPSLPITASTPAFPVLEGCEHLPFAAALTVSPESTQADEPSGYEVGLEVPQAPKDASGVATPPAKNVEVKLPLGTTISPSSANGLLSCDETGPAGINIEGPEAEAEGADGLAHPVAGHCPKASQIGTIKATTPLLAEELTGHLFLATPHCGGSGQPACASASAVNGELFGVYMELEAPQRGVIVKLAGTAHVDPSTGQITTVFEDLPQFPIGHVSVALKAGPRAPLANAQSCGVATSESIVAPWSEPQTSPSRSSSAFGVDWNGAGAPCPSSAPFAPGFIADTKSPVAGAYSPFSLTLKREDREQDVRGLSTTLPPGLLANLSKVARCPEPQASEPSLSACPAASQIGTATGAVGPGSEPYYATGKVFFTGPYGGAPFGLTIVVPAVAGPFNLGFIVERVALFIDPHTVQATAVTGSLPQMLDGVPLRYRTLNVTLDRPEFTLNPTGCAQKIIAGTAYSTTGATASLTSPFAVAGCRNLAFKPVLSGSTDARSTKLNGTGVKIKVAYPSSGTAESNIAKVVVGFPKQLPVRLETLQQACRASVFEANPAACPKASMVGSAIVHTPILAAPLVGPAYLVSYGNAKFPDVVFVLQGEGVTVDLDGQSFVSHSGALTATFANVPDTPFSSFETTLPAGKYSQFTSSRSTAKRSASQCGENLKMPVTMVSQSGVEIKQTVKLKVAGCRKKAKHARAKKGHAKGGRSNKGRRRRG